MILRIFNLNVLVVFNLVLVLVDNFGGECFGGGGVSAGPGSPEGAFD